MHWYFTTDDGWYGRKEGNNLMKGIKRKKSSINFALKIALTFLFFFFFVTIALIAINVQRSFFLKNLFSISNINQNCLLGRTDYEPWALVLTAASAFGLLCKSLVSMAVVLHPYHGKSCLNVSCSFNGKL